MENDKPKERMQRSPSYPSIDLEDAVNKIKAIYEREKRTSAPPDVIGQDLGYSPKSSGIFSMISSLKQFGLLEGRGNLRLSELALDIIFGEDGSEKKIAALKRAALSPDIFSDLWEKYGGEIPSENALKVYLIREKGYNDKVVPNLINEYKKTIAFAKLESGDIIDSGVEQSTKEDVDKPMIADQAIQIQRDNALKMMIRPYSIPLDKGSAQLMLPTEKISESDFDLLIGTLNLWKEKIVGKKETG